MPLSGVKVLDLGRFIAGPFCALLLGDMGADVIKIELPGRGDEIRSHGVLVNGESSYFVGMNRNKKSVTLDLRSEDGKQIFRRLVQEADVVVENFRPDVMRKLGCDYEALRRINPGIVYCGISGFGKDGPYALRPCFDFIAQGMSGVMSVTGLPDGVPVRMGISISDAVAAIYAAYGIALALLARKRSGEGQEVQVSLLDGMTSLLSFQADKYFQRGEIPGRAGNDHPVTSPYGTFKTRDGYMNIAPAGAQMWERLTRALGREDLLRDPRFLTNDLRCQHRNVLNHIITEITAGRSTAEWIDRLNDFGVPCGPIYDLSQVFADPQVRHQKMVLEVEQPTGSIKTLGSPVKLSGLPAPRRGPAPQLGQHTVEILEGLGYTTEEIQSLQNRGVV